MCVSEKELEHLLEMREEQVVFGPATTNGPSTIADGALWVEREKIAKFQTMVNIYLQDELYITNIAIFFERARRRWTRTPSPGSYLQRTRRFMYLLHGSTSNKR